MPAYLGVRKAIYLSHLTARIERQVLNSSCSTAGLKDTFLIIKFALRALLALAPLSSTILHCPPN